MSESDGDNDTDEDNVQYDLDLVPHMRRSAELRNTSHVLRSSLNEIVARKNVPGMKNLTAGFSKARYHSGERLWGDAVTTRAIVDYQLITASEIKTFAYKKRMNSQSRSVMGMDNNLDTSFRDEYVPQRDEPLFQVSKSFMDKFYPENRDMGQLYFPGKPLPSDDFQGRIKVHVWGNSRLMLDIDIGSMRIVCGGMMYIFELPRDLVIAVTDRLSHSSHLHVVRHGDILGLFDGSMPDNWRREDLVAGQDYTSAALPYAEAMRFLMTDVKMGTRHNDTANLAIKSFFLW